MRISRALLTLAAASTFLSSGAAQTPAASWSEPVNLGAPINSAFQENRVALTEDGLSVYFSSTRPCGDGDAVLDANIWVARRSTTFSPWRVECLRINVDGFLDAAPDLTPDGLWLFFVSDRPGSTSIQRDIWVTRRRNAHDDQGWSEPVNPGPPLNTNAPEIGSSYFVTRAARHFRLLPNQRLMFGRPTSGNFDIWEVNMLDGVPFGTARKVEELSTADYWESGPSVSPDGLEVFFHRSLPNGPFDIFTSTRAEPDAPWSPAINLGSPVNLDATSDAGPTRSSDRNFLFFESNRSGGFGSSDIWVSTRVGQ